MAASCVCPVCTAHEDTVSIWLFWIGVHTGLIRGKQ